MSVCARNYIAWVTVVAVKLCCSAVTSDMKLVASAGSDRAWVYTVQADFADEEAKTEQLAIRFRNAECK